MLQDLLSRSYCLESVCYPLWFTLRSSTPCFGGLDVSWDLLSVSVGSFWAFNFLRVFHWDPILGFSCSVLMRMLSMLLFMKLILWLLCDQFRRSISYV